MNNIKQSPRKSTSTKPERDIWYPKDARLRSKSAADGAKRTALHVGKAEPIDPEPDETTLFVAVHTCAYRAVGQPSGRRVSRSERAKWLRRRRVICSYIVEHNLGLVYLCVSRFRFAQVERDELRSEGLLAMVRAVDWFNPWMGVRFSTYAYNAITRGLVRLNQRAGRHRRLFPVSYDVPIPPAERDSRWAELYADRLQQAMKTNLGELSEREFAILAHRFPSGEKPRLTLKQVGDACGLSKERVRQIQNRALRKLRDVLEADPALQ